MEDNNQKNLPFHNRLGFAFDGLLFAWKTENSFKTHIILALITLVAAFILKLSRIEMAIIFLTIAMVLAAELCNTAMEYLVDFLHPSVNPTIKKIKDVSAAMVLVVSLGALFVSGFIFVPAVLKFFRIIGDL